MAEISIFANDRAGLLQEISRVFSEENLSIIRLSTMTSKQKIATLVLSFEVRDTEQLEQICNKIRVIRDVQAVKRTNG